MQIVAGRSLTHIHCPFPLHTVFPPTVAEKREQSHAIKTDVDEALETVTPVPMTRGDVLVHDERVVHGSSANQSDKWR